MYIYLSIYLSIYVCIYLYLWSHTWVPAMPDGEEGEGGELADVLVVEELEPLVHVLGHPPVGVDVKCLKNRNLE